MKKTILVMAVAISLFACTSPQVTKNNDADAENLAAFKENSKVTISVFEAFAKKDLNEWGKFISDSIKGHGPVYGQEAVVGKEVMKQRLEGFHKLFNNIKPNDIMLLPGVDTITYKPNGDVRAYVRWTDDGALNGAKLEHKYYAVFKFNKDHLMIDADEYFDVSGLINAATAPKK
jgi:hypothetical protein